MTIEEFIEANSFWAEDNCFPFDVIGVVPVQDLCEFMRGKVAVGVGSLAIVLACVSGGIAVTRTELDTAVASLQKALLQPASSEAGE